jgi:DHA3 family macrolide efflux protein-like MFS transporter
MARVRPTGMRAFTLVWLGQVISLTGTAMAAFGVSVWAWKTTGSATALSIVAFFNFTPTIIMSPVAGALVDRWNRKIAMGVSDVMSGLGTTLLLVLYVTGHLQIWHLCAVGLLSGTFQAFQWPAYQAAISTMMPKEHYGRASGMMSLAQNGSGIVAPLVAGTVVAMWGLVPVFLFDIASFCIAVALLLCVDIPQPKRSHVGEEASGSLWKETVFGWRYIVARRPLLWLQLSFFATNLVSSVCLTLWNPMILARTGDSSRSLGVVNTVSAVGGVVGGVVMAAWGGPHRKIRGVLWGMVSVSVLGIMLMGFGRTLPIWLIAGFLGSCIVPLMNGSNDAIWQAKVPHDVQGKVFGTRMMIAQVSVPIAMLTAGPLADRVFEPRMMPGGSWASTFGALTGTGRGAGMSLMYVLFGAGALLLSIASFAVRDIRDVETLLPDYVPPGEQEEQVFAAEHARIDTIDER